MQLVAVDQRNPTCGRVDVARLGPSSSTLLSRVIVSTD